MNNIINIEDINLASALLAATAPIAKRAEIIITDRGERKVFYFTDTLETREMIRKWKDPDFVKNNPEDPFALVKAALIPETCPEEDKMEIRGRLNS